jgi:oligopeptide transport system substrate-binding protein
MISDANASINMYEVGQIDRVGLTKDFVKTYKDKGEYVTVPQATAIYIKYNENWADPATGAKPFSNAKVRKAFSYAIDRKNLCANILSPGARPAYGYVPFGIPGISPDKDFRSEAGDMMDASLDGNGEEAKKLLNEGLAELGLTSFPNGVVFLGGDQNPAAITRMQYFQEQWRTRLGVEVAIDSPDFKTRLEKCSSGNYQMVWEIWGGDYNDPMTFMDLWTTESSQNQCGFTSKDYDTYIQTAKSTADQTVRMDAMHKAEQILADEMPITWLYFPGGNAAVKPWLSGYLDWPVGAAPEYKWAVVDTAKRGY